MSPSSSAKRKPSLFGSILGPLKSAQSRQRLATAASRGDGPHHSLHASAQYCEYNEDLIFD